MAFFSRSLWTGGGGNHADLYLPTWLVWAKRLPGSRVAVLAINLAEDAQQISLSAAELSEALGGATDKPLVGADVWTCPALAPLGPGGPRCPAGSLSHVEPGGSWSTQLLSHDSSFLVFSEREQ